MEAFIEGINGKTVAAFPHHTVAAPAGQTVAAPVGQPLPPSKPGEKHKIFRYLALGLALILIVGGVWKIASGIGGKEEPASHTTEISAREPGADVPASGIQTPAGIQMPAGMDKVVLKEYGDEEHLNIDIGIPEGYESVGDDGYAFSSPDGSATLQAGFYAYSDEFPIYSIADAEENAERYVQYYVGLLKSTKITKQEIISRGYQKIGSQNAYLIQFYATESGGTSMEFLAAFVECQNDYGCYNLVGSYPQGDEKAKAEIFASIYSLRSNGPVKTSQILFRDEQLPFQFLYWDNGEGFSFDVVNDHRLEVTYKSAYSDFNRVMIMTKPLTDELNKEKWMDDIEAIMAEEAECERLRDGKRWDAERGGVDWITSRYSFLADEDRIYVDIYTGEIGELVFMAALYTTSEQTLFDDDLIWNVTNSIRPLR